MNASSRQISNASASQVRRSSRHTRGSTAQSPHQRQLSTRRASSIRDTEDLFDGINWNDLASFNLDFDHSLGAGHATDITLQGQEDNFVALLNNNNNNENGNGPAYTSEQLASTNFFDNYNVAVPGTPRSINFPGANQQIGIPMGYQAPSVPPTPQYINGQLMVPVTFNGETVLVAMTKGQITAALNAQAPFSAVAPSTMLADGKRSSVPKSPARQRQSSQFRTQTRYEDPLVGGNEYLDPTLLDSRNTVYIEPNAYHGNSLEVRGTQPYFQSTYPQGAPSPGDPLNNRIQFYHPGTIYEQQNHSSKVSNYLDLTLLDFYADIYQLPPTRTRSSSVSTYPSHNSSSRHSHDNSLNTRNKKSRHAKMRTPLDKRVSVFAGEGNEQYQKPKIADFNPEVRINKTTKGLTTRTGKINMYDPRRHYTYAMHPLGTPEQPEGADWEGKRFTHKYNDASTRDQNSGEKTIPIYEFEDRSMPAAKIRDFILSYPNHRNKLTLRIQVAPGDSGRRYKKGADKCRFAECPARSGGQNRTIKHGFYRVAFDERSDDEYDPFAACCGFAHLYCMERFLDFEYICRKANVVVDTRVQLRGEPNGRFAAALEGKQAEAAETAENFILAAKNKSPNTRRERNDGFGVRQLRFFAGYPTRQIPDQYSPDEVWDVKFPYEHTLGYHMTRLTEGHRAYAQLLQFAGGAGGLGPTKISVHRGDLGLFIEAYVRAKRENSRTGKKISSKGAETNGYKANDPFSVEVRRRVERAKRVIAEMAETLPQIRRRKNRGASTLEDQHAKEFEEFEEFEENSYPEGQEPWAVSENESDIDYTGRVPRKGPRSSKRITAKQPVNYYDDFENGQGHNQRSRQLLKRKRSENENQLVNKQNQQYFEHIQQHHNQNMHHNDAQSYGNGKERSNKRKRSSISHVGGPQAQVFQETGLSSWNELDYGQSVDHDDLGLEFHVHPTPPPPERKRKRSSQSEEQFDYLFEDSPVSARSPKRLRSGTSDLNRNSVPRLSITTGSIMRHPGAQTPSGSKRHASFKEEPVSHQKVFNADAPPQHVQSRMIKELETNLSNSPRSTRDATDSPGRTLRSGRSIGSISE